MEFKSDQAKTWLEDENGKQIALLDHPEVRPGVVNIVHTEVDSSLGGQGIAGKITQAVAEKLREEGLKAELTCSYAIRWFAKHPEYADVLADPDQEKQKADMLAADQEKQKADMLAGPACGLRR